MFDFTKFYGQIRSVDMILKTVTVVCVSWTNQLLQFELIILSTDQNVLLESNLVYTISVMWTLLCNLNTTHYILVGKRAVFASNAYCYIPSIKDV